METGYGLSVLTPPAEEPVGIAEAKLWLREDASVEDATIHALIASARNLLETEYDRRFVTQTLRMYLDGFPPCGEIRFPVGPVQSVSAIHYLDYDEVEQVLPVTHYRSDTSREPHRVWLAPGSFWPTPAAVPGSVRVTFVAGHGDASAVPEAVKQAIRLAVSAWFHDDRRSQIVVGASVAEMPLGVDRLMRSQWTGAY